MTIEDSWPLLAPPGPAYDPRILLAPPGSAYDPRVLLAPPGSSLFGLGMGKWDLDCGLRLIPVR